MGVPVNFSFLTNCTDLSKSNTVPVAEIRKSDWKRKEQKISVKEIQIVDGLTSTCIKQLTRLASNKKNKQTTNQKKQRKNPQNIT